MTNLSHPPSPSPPYKVYPDIEEISPESVQTEQDEELYHKSRLYGCRTCDITSENKMYMVIHGLHFCSNNGKSKYHQHQQEYINRKIEKLNEEGKL